MSSYYNKFKYIGDWGLGPRPNPQSPLPNPPSPIPIKLLKNLFLKSPNY